MKKKSTYAYVLAFGLAAVLNLLYITDALSFVAVQVGGCVVGLAGFAHFILFFRKKDSPFYYKNLKYNPILAMSFCVSALAFIITLSVAVFGGE